MRKLLILLGFLLSFPAEALVSPVIDVTSKGAIPNDGLDDRAAFDSAIAAAALSGASGVIFIPCGVFDVTRTPASVGAINIASRSHLTFRGNGDCSIVRNKFDSSVVTSDFYTFNVAESNDVRFEDLVLDGNSAFLTSADEQTHLVRTLDASDLSFKNVEFRHSWGDAVKLIGLGTYYTIESIDDSGTDNAVVATLADTSSIALGTPFDVEGTVNFDGHYTVASKTATTLTFAEYRTFMGTVAAETGGTAYTITGIDDDGSALFSVKIDMASTAGLVSGSRLIVTGTTNYNGAYTVAEVFSTYVLTREYKSGSLAAENSGTVTTEAGTLISSNGRFFMRDCHIQDMRRNGITFHNNTFDAVIETTVFEDISDQSIDFEPGGHGPKHVSLDNLHIYDETKANLSLALSGGNNVPDYKTVGISLTNSYIEGTVNMARSGSTRIVGNTILSRSGCIEALQFAQELMVANNHLSCNLDGVSSGYGSGNGINLVQGGLTGDNGPSVIAVHGNQITMNVDDGSTSFFGVSVTGGYGKISITDNYFRSLEPGPAGASADTAISIKNANSGEITTGVVVSGNTFEGVQYGLRLSYNIGTIEDTLFDGNVMVAGSVTPIAGAFCSGAGPQAWLAIGANNIYGVGSTGIVDGCDMDVTIADDAAGTQPTDTTAPTTQEVLVGCQDADGCIYDPDVANGKAGRTLHVCLASGSEDVVLNDSADVEVMGPGSVVLTERDCASCTYSAEMGKWHCSGSSATLVTSSGTGPSFSASGGIKQLRWTKPYGGSSTTITENGLRHLSSCSVLSNPGHATTGFAESLTRLRCTSTAGTTARVLLGTQGGTPPTEAYAWRGNGADRGGFYVSITGGISDASLVSTGTLWMGLFGLGTNGPTDNNPSTQTDSLFCGSDVGDTTMSIMHNDSSGIATKIPLGANFPTNTTKTDVYRCELYAAPNGSTVDYRVTRLNTGHVASGTISSDLPTSTAFMHLGMGRWTGGTATAIAIDWLGTYFETEY